MNEQPRPILPLPVNQKRQLSDGHNESGGGNSMQSAAEEDDPPSRGLNGGTDASTSHDLLPSDDANSSFDERALQRHFKDVESSFIPDTTFPTVAAGWAAERQEHQQGVVGADDTYLEFAHPPQSTDGPSLGLEAEEELLPGSGPLLARHGGGSEGEENSLSEVTAEDSDGVDWQLASSPAVAAAKRTLSRNVATTSASKTGPPRTTSDVLQSHDRSSSSATSILLRPTSEGSTVRPPSRSQDTLPGAQDNSHQPRFHDPRSLSSESSATHTSSGSNDAVNVDYALQTGGSVASKALPRNASSSASLLSRLPSLGSLSSYATDDNTAVRKPGETPRAPRTTTHFDAPTDTVITRHVRSIQVPDTVARDFRARNLGVDFSPQKRPVTSGEMGDFSSPRKNLTLKEQGGKIDKLTKENFDLKLKIHFLDQALQNRSDDGVKELIEKNVQLQTDLANERKESQAMRRKMREMERKVKEQEDRLAQAAREQQQQDRARGDAEDDPTLQAEMHEEILYLRQQLDHTENQVTTLREEVMTKEFEKRKMAEHMRGMAGARGEDAAGMKETLDMWQDLLNAESGRREQAEEDLSKLREQFNALRVERASPAPNRGVGEENAALVNGGSNSAIVAKLKHENAELRRDLGAQTSMLTSRNRERERLQQEIEDLKLLQRKSDGARSVTGESIFDRSISRAHQHRAPSHVSDHTQATEAERDDWEQKEGRLRDQNAELKIKFQELERTHATYLEYVSALEGDFKEMETELNECHEDLLKLQAERDETLQAYEERDAEYGQLREEALAEISGLDDDKKMLEAQLSDAVGKAHKLQARLQTTTDGYKNLQAELRDITQSVMHLEEEKQTNMRNIRTLEQQITEAEADIQKWELKCSESEQKNKKLEITQESLHSEITFLREEQEGDKIKIGELEDALNAAKQTVLDEQEKLREVQNTMVEERQQRDILENKSRGEVQKVLDDLNAETSKTKDEVRRLRRALSAKEVEASSWKQRLEELEQNLRKVLGDRDGTKQSLLADIQKLQRELETTASELDRTKMDAADKDRLLRHRDGLLEGASLESRRLSDLLDKERAARKRDLEQFEKTSRGQASHLRTVAQKEARVLELETAYSQDKRKMAALEQQLRDQLHERNLLLLALWNRLSTLCGVEWAQMHSLVNGEVPSAEIIGKHLPAFSRNILAAVKAIEALIGNFKVRIRGIERDLSRDYQTLQHNLDLRLRRMDTLEYAVRDAQRTIADDALSAAASSSSAAARPATSRSILNNSNKLIKHSEETARLKQEIKLLKSELKFHRQHPSAMAQQMMNNQPQQAASEGGGGGLARRLSTSASSPARAIASLLRHHSSSAVERVQTPPDDAVVQAPAPPPAQTASTADPADQRWVHRLKELERRLKAEREGRLLDRQGARQRLEEGRAENEELKQLLERERVRHGFYDFPGSRSASAVGAGSERAQSEERQ